MKNAALAIVIIFGALSLFGGFIFGTAEIEQLCQVLLLLSFVAYTEKGTYINAILKGYFLGAGWELVDEHYHLNDGYLLMNDYVFTLAWIVLVLIECYRIYKRKQTTE